MSRIGKQPVAVPAGVKVQVTDGKVRVEGPKGKLELPYHRNMKVEYDEAHKAVKVTRPDDERQNRALHGLTRALIASEAAATFRIESVGGTAIERLLSLVFLGDLVSLYLAVLRGVDPGPVEMLERMKSTLAGG